MSLLSQLANDIDAQVNDVWDLSEIPQFVSEHTYLLGARYSFVDHEFQERILGDTSQIVNTQKCSQIGMSEATARWAVAAVNMLPKFNVIVTFPFTGDANDFARTRVDPFIRSSPRLMMSLNTKNDNSDYKQFGENFLYFRGTNGKTQAISIPADCIVSDEIDRSDPHTLSQYQSRMTHSPFRMRRNFSTPTVPGYGIALAMESSLRFHNLCRCNHCNHMFKPDYFEHVKIPEYDGSLRAINKNMLGKLRWREAALLCPKCGLIPRLTPEHREWVAENESDNFDPHGYFVSPFDAPKIITPAYLVQASTTYARYSEFENQNLGITSIDSSESMTLHELSESFLEPGTDLRSSNLHHMGIDLGLICYITIGRITPENQFLVVHRERVPVGQLMERARELRRSWRVLITVMDSLPYTDLVQRMQAQSKNLYGAVYSQSKSLTSFAIKMFEGDASEGKLPIHTAQINRDKALDMLLGAVKAKELVVAPVSPEEDELYIKHLLDMRRVQQFDNNQELVWTWVKSRDGQDHYHHSTLYLFVACQLKATASRSAPLGTGLLVKTMKLRQPSA